MTPTRENDTHNCRRQCSSVHVQDIHVEQNQRISAFVSSPLTEELNDAKCCIFSEQREAISSPFKRVLIRKYLLMHLIKSVILAGKWVREAENRRGICELTSDIRSFIDQVGLARKANICTWRKEKAVLISLCNPCCQSCSLEVLFWFMPTEDIFTTSPLVTLDTHGSCVSFWFYPCAVVNMAAQISNTQRRGADWPAWNREKILWLEGIDFDNQKRSCAMHCQEKAIVRNRVAAVCARVVMKMHDDCSLMEHPPAKKTQFNWIRWNWRVVDLHQFDTVCIIYLRQLI